MVRIRQAVPADQDRLAALERNAPQGDSIKLLSERKHFFVRAERFDDPIVMVAESEQTGDILGVMGVGPVQLRLGGNPMAGALIFDWRANQAAAQGLPTHMMRLWQAVRRQIEARNLSFIFGYIKADNVRSLGIVGRMGVQTVEQVIFYTIPVYRALTSEQRSRSARVLTAQAITDAGLDLAGLQKAFAGRDLLPDHKEMPRLQLLAERYRRAVIQAGRSSMKIWDATADYRQRVVHLPGLYRAARPVFRLLSPLIPLPRIPKPGEEIRAWYLYDLILHRQSDLAPLLEQARRLAVADKIDYLIAAAGVGDPANALLTRYAWLKLPYQLVFQALVPLPPPRTPTYFDIRCI
jgi:hypothetical protein